jgi:hypothetical protein
VHLREFELRGAGKLWQTAVADLNARDEPGERPAADIVETSINETSRTLAVAPLSINVFGFEVKQASLCRKACVPTAAPS